MTIWAKGRSFLSLIDYRKQTLTISLNKIRREIEQHNIQINDCQKIKEKIETDIKVSRISGVCSGKDILVNLQQQSVFLSKLNIVMDEMLQLQKQHDKKMASLDLLRIELQKLEKKNIKIEKYLKKKRLEERKRISRLTESYTEELCSYVAKK